MRYLCQYLADSMHLKINQSYCYVIELNHLTEVVHHLMVPG